MKTLVKAVLVTLAIIIATITCYGVIAHLTGGITALVEKTFGGFASALSIIGLLVIAVGFGWWQFWLSEHRERSSARSLGYAVIGVAVVLVAAIVGLTWVEWSWSLLQIILLMIPAALASTLIALFNRQIFGPE